MRNYTPRNVLMMFYNGLIGSYLHYGIRAWGSCSQNLLDSLQDAQDKIIRALLFLPYSANTQPGYSQLKVLNVKSIFKHEVVKLIHSVYYNYNPLAFPIFLKSPPMATPLVVETHLFILLPNPELNWVKGHSDILVLRNGSSFLLL